MEFNDPSTTSVSHAQIEKLPSIVPKKICLLLMHMLSSYQAGYKKISLKGLCTFYEGQITTISANYRIAIFQVPFGGNRFSCLYMQLLTGTACNQNSKIDLLVDIKCYAFTKDHFIGIILSNIQQLFFNVCTKNELWVNELSKKVIELYCCTFYLLIG